MFLMGDQCCYWSPIGNIGKINNIGMPNPVQGLLVSLSSNCAYGKIAVPLKNHGGEDGGFLFDSVDNYIV